MTRGNKLIALFLASQILVVSACTDNSLLDVKAGRGRDSAGPAAARDIGKFTLTARAAGDWTNDTRHDRAALILKDCTSREELAIARGVNTRFDRQANVSTIVSEGIGLASGHGTCVSLRRLRMPFSTNTNDVRLDISLSATSAAGLGTRDGL